MLKLENNLCKWQLPHKYSNPFKINHCFLMFFRLTILVSFHHKIIFPKTRSTYLCYDSPFSHIIFIILHWPIIVIYLPMIYSYFMVCILILYLYFNFILVTWETITSHFNLHDCSMVIWHFDNKMIEWCHNGLIMKWLGCLQMEITLTWFCSYFKNGLKWVDYFCYIMFNSIVWYEF